MSNTVAFPGQSPLDFVGTANIRPFPGKFSPSNMLAIGSMVGEIPVGNVSNDFLALFFTIPFESPKKSPGLPAVSIPYWNLARATHDTDIFNVWMGAKNKIFPLVRIFQIMSLGKKGPSLTNGVANVAFVPPVFSIMPRTVYWSVYMGTWHLDVIPEPVNDLRAVRNRSRLPTGVRVFGGHSEDMEEPLAF